MKKDNEAYYGGFRGRMEYDKCEKRLNRKKWLSSHKVFLCVSAILIVAVAAAVILVVTNVI